VEGESSVELRGLVTERKKNLEGTRIEDGTIISHEKKGVNW